MIKWITLCVYKSGVRYHWVFIFTCILTCPTGFSKFSTTDIQWLVAMLLWLTCCFNFLPCFFYDFLKVKLLDSIGEARNVSHFTIPLRKKKQNKNVNKINSLLPDQVYANYFIKTRFLCGTSVSRLLYLRQPGACLNLLSPDIKMHILLAVLHTFLMELVRRISPNIKTSYPWWSLPVFSSLECLIK